MQITLNPVFQDKLDAYIDIKLLQNFGIRYNKEILCIQPLKIQTFVINEKLKYRRTNTNH